MNKPTSSSAFGARGPWGAAPSPQQILAKLQQAVALHQQGQFAEAAALYDAVLKAQPKNFDALHLRGVIALQTEDFKRAVDLITQALKVDRNNASAYNHRGAAYAALKEYDFAILNYTKAIELQPQSAEAWNNRGNLHLARGQLDAALADMDKALAVNPGYFQAFHNRGNVLSEMGRHIEAIASYQRAVDMNPSADDLRWSLGMACLRNGEFSRGWAYSEARLKDWIAREWQGAEGHVRWQGEPLAGKTILLRSEQGLGDTIQFARYAPLLAEQGAKVIIEVQKAVVPLMSSLLAAHPCITLVTRGEPLPAFDVYCPLMSLPMVFKTDAGNVPPPTPIAASPEKVAKWQAILGEKTKPRVGIVWSGNAAHVDDGKRSMALQDLLPLLSDDLEWISLHKDLRPADEALLAQHPRIRHFGAEQEDFADAAAMLELLDLVITVDTSMAHLAGSMGKPVWILLAFNADWRWLTGREDTPWYPGAKLFRQQTCGDWPELLGRVSEALQASIKR